jgi:hypothetical protein
MIDAELDRNDHCSILYNCDRKRLTIYKIWFCKDSVKSFLNLNFRSSKIVNRCPIGKEADRCQLQKWKHIREMGQPWPMKNECYGKLL